MATTKRRRKKTRPKPFAAVWGTEKFIVRLVAVFISYAFNAIAAGALVGVNVGKSILMAGIMGLATTFTFMARAYIDDGVMTEEELNFAFQKTSDKLDESV